MTPLESVRRLRPRRLIALGVALVLLSAGLAIALWEAARPLEELAYSTAVFDRNGSLLRLTLSVDDKYRIRADGSQLPSRFTEALLLKEDRAFFYHPGVSVPALVRAFWHSMIRRDYRAGGSTITMQTARLLYHLDTGNVRGKLQQILDALLLNLLYSKRRILDAYASLVPCGGNVEGFPAASLLYFRKPLSALSLPEMFMLSVLPQKPRRGGLDAPPSSLRQARDVLWRTWLRHHPADKALALEFELPEDLSLSIPFEAPHAVVSLLRSHPGQARVDSTMDVRLQNVVGRIVRDYQRRHATTGIMNASALLVRRRGMEVLAEVGSADFFNANIDGQVNGTEAKRSPGSALKPFLYGLAMDQSIIHPMTVLKDAPLHFSGYNPDNFDNEFVGPITATRALIDSRNVPAVHLSQKVKSPDLYDFLREGGVTGLRPRGDYGVSLVLGTAEVTMKELAALYGVLANDGKYSPLRQTREGTAASVPPRGGRELLSPQAAWLVLSILREKPRPDDLGTGPLLAKARPVAWKTGTSIGFRDAWSIGIFDSFILCVWVGNFDGTGNPEFLGLRSAAPLMWEIIDALRAGSVAAVYASDGGPEEPPGIITTQVCAVSGKIPGPYCPTVGDTLFIPGTSPIDVCDVHQQVVIDNRTGLRRSRPIPGATHTEVYEIWPSDLLDLFDQAGLPRRRPPAYAPEESLENQALMGGSLQIASPLAKVQYAVRVGDPVYGEIPLIAVAPSDSTTLFWFLDESYLGQSPARKALFWKAHPGTFTLRATDEHGRSASCRFTVVPRE